METKTKEPRDPKGKTEFEPMQAGGTKLKQKLKKHSDGTVGTLQD